MVTSYFRRPVFTLRIVFNYKHKISGWDCLLGLSTNYGKMLVSDLSVEEILRTYTDRHPSHTQTVVKGIPGVRLGFKTVGERR
jgi:hypothetical protein